jgi:hypothetical protein
MVLIERFFLLLSSFFAAVHFQLTLTLNMPGATMTVFKKGQDFAFRVPHFLSGTTNASGVVSFSLLSGTYELDVTATGFGSVTVAATVNNANASASAILVAV